MGTANEGSREIITMEMYRRLPEYKEAGKLQATRIGKYGMLSGDEDDCREPLLFENDDLAAAGWSSNCMIDRCYYMPDPQTDGRYRISFGARADIKEACSSLEIRLLVYEEKAGAFRELRTEQGTDTSHLSCDMEWEFTGSEEELAEYIPYAEFSWTDQTGTHNACQVSRFQYQIDELLSKYEHAWPKKEDTAQVFNPSKPQPVPVYASKLTPPPFSENEPGSYVLVALFREPEDLHDCDYVCYVEKEAGQPHIEVPFICRLTAAKNWRFRELCVEQSYCMLTDKSNASGAARLLSGMGDNYIESGFVFRVSEDKKTATVSLITPWKEYILQPGDMKKFFYDMDIHLEIIMEDNSGHMETAFLDLSSRNRGTSSAIGGEEVLLYPIALMWGCIAGDAVILMGDGQRKRICDIRIGERILQPDDGRPILVQNVWRGWEEELITIRTQDGGFVQMTEEHPVRQESGYIRAGELKPGDTVYGEEGRTMTVVSVKKEPYNGFVYNLDLQRDGTYAGNGYFLANGIVVGDNRMQNDR